MKTYDLEFLTPCFSVGAYRTRAEIRPPSIRGQLHWWHRMLGGSEAEERAIYGSVHQDFGGRGLSPAASAVVIRVSSVRGEQRTIPTLPHKHGNLASPKQAFVPGSTFRLHVGEARDGLGAHAARFQRTLEAWLLLGSLGLRTTRGAGSFALRAASDPTLDLPKDWPGYEARVRTLLSGSSLRWSLLAKRYAKGEEARRDASDTIGGRQDPSGEDDLRRLRHPLGRVFGGRKTSPLRFRVVRLADECRLIALWDGRGAVTGNQPSDLDGAIAALARKGKLVGQLLKDAPPV